MKVFAFTLLLIFVGAALQQEQTLPDSTKGCLANVVAVLQASQSFEIQRFLSGEKYTAEVVTTFITAVKACFGNHQPLAMKSVPVAGYLDSCAELLQAAKNERQSALAWALFLNFDQVKSCNKTADEYFARYNRGDCIKP